MDLKKSRQISQKIDELKNIKFMLRIKHKDIQLMHQLLWNRVTTKVFMPCRIPRDMHVVIKRNLSEFIKSRQDYKTS
jgi:hypothetical protein